MRASLVVHHCVDLVDDDRADVAENLAALLGGEQNEERLGRRDQDMRRPPQHRPPRGTRRVARAHRGSDLGEWRAAGGRERRDLGERTVEVLLDVVPQRFEGRHVHDVRAIVERAGRGLADERVDARQHRGQRLA